MSIEVQSDSPLAKALQEVVRNRLVEMGWSTGLQDDTLCEYIMLMLANGKTKEELATELATDLLEMDGQNPDTASFADWLFQQKEIINHQLNGGPAPDTSVTSAAVPSVTSSGDQSADAAMSDGVEEMRQNVYYLTIHSAVNSKLTNVDRPPTGPKAQRNGIQKGRDKRMFGQLKTSLGQPNDAALHRVRGSTGTGRINTHSSREPPKGPRSQQIQRGLGMGNGRGMANMQMPGMMNGGAMQTPEFMSPQEQMAFYQSLADNARVMALQMQHMTQAIGGGMFAQGNQPGKPLSERIDRPNRQQNRGDRRHGNQSQHRAKDTEMSDGGAAMESDTRADANDQSQAVKDLSRTVCRFDITCQKPDCPYAHHSPISGPYDNLETIDVDTECTYGVACKNKFCRNRHPSRAKKLAHQKEQECTFGPFCTRYPNCPFKHPNVRACKNGADCTVQDCQFYHSKILCKHNPCTNNYCPYKHEAGQKQKWSETGKVAERKFVDDTAPEEVILPGKQDDAAMATDANVQSVQPEAEIVT